ncbi:hypothetical protein L210DRAFT_3502477 [Boletus edulis BED1]|uniref:Glucose-methanol-choline oxidoreductase N-terminal domain-containing protein n=1 Tax=Boletus edulis BED1 TaxID=1328754 RepID=A0AAD4GH66_BOLED|nr:hypothetical protein L210DRAFT_3502477 [Boletus edulis BED1]
MCEPDENEMRPDEVLRLLGSARYVRFIMNSSSRYLDDETQSVGEERRLFVHVDGCFIYVFATWLLSEEVITTAYSYYYDLVLPFFNTMNKLGVVTNYSEASGDLIGAWTYTASVDPQTNTRSYSTNAYYDRVSSRPNIVCLTGAYVSKVVLSDSKNGVSRAMGVEFYSSGQLFFASARREVILSAGALQTPQILELSGIGNPNINILRKLGIPLKVDLPGHFAHERLREYRETRRGMLSSTLSSLVFLPASTFIPADTMKRMLASLDRALQTPEIIELAVQAMVHATSTSIFDPPEIDLATLDSPGDIDMTMLLEAIKYTFKVMQARDLTAKIVEPLPTWSYDHLREYIRSMIGTAAMLPRSANGVKVYGTANLRVADASILPIHLGSHPQATLYG